MSPPDVPVPSPGRDGGGSHGRMSWPSPMPSVEDMISAQTPPPRSAEALSWPVILGLAVIALARPVTNVVLDQLALDPGPVVPLAWTAVITALWVAVVGIGRVARPLLTLVLVGLAYGVLALALSGILSPLLLGHLSGPLANPLAIVPMLLVNALWGLIAGLLALLVQRGRGVSGR